MRITTNIENGKLTGCIVEQAGLCLLHPESLVSAAYAKILEVSVARELFDLKERKALLITVALWEGGLPVDSLPQEGMLEAMLGGETYAWEME
jgi:hypothetical protein